MGSGTWKKEIVGKIAVFIETGYNIDDTDAPISYTVTILPPGDGWYPRQLSTFKCFKRIDCGYSTANLGGGGRRKSRRRRANRRRRTHRRRS